jgi:branched-chain amino acid transport system permease protein
MILELWQSHGSSIEFALAFSLFALSTYVALRGGVLSLAAVPFAAVTGYASLVLIEDYGLPIEIALIVGVLLGMGVAVLSGIPLLRLESHWIALATIAFVLMARVVALNLVSVTGGAAGVPLGRTIEVWHLVVVVVITSWIMARHRRSRLGLAAEAVRTHGEVAETLGVDVVATRRVLLAVSGAVAGVGGVVYANLVQFLSPDTFYVSLAFVMLASVVLGGAFHWFGAIVGAFVFTILPDVLRELLPDGERIVNGVLLIIIMVFLPRGLVDPTRGRRRRLRRAQEHEQDADDGDEPEFHDLALSGRLIRDLPDVAEDAPLALKVRIGPNGAGKSSLLALISGISAPDAGSIEVFGNHVAGESPVHIAKKGVARTYQTVQLFPDLSVIENIAVGFHQHRSTGFWDPVFMTRRDRIENAEVQEKARELMDRVGVIGRPEQEASTLSYANQRRVEIARALATEPSLLLMDEPTAGMHRLGSQAVGELVLELRDQGLTVVLIEHNLGVVMNYCDSALVMNFGRELCKGDPARCLEQPQVIEAYFGRKADAERIEALLELRKHPRSSGS